MEANVKSLQSHSPDSPALDKYEEVAQILTQHETAQAPDGVKWVLNLCMELKVPALSTFGVNEENIPIVVTKSQKASSMKGNPTRLTDEELAEILKKAL